jgi:hypothetical protein
MPTAAKKSTRLTVEASTHAKVIASMMPAETKRFFKPNFPLCVSDGGIQFSKIFLRIPYFYLRLNMQERKNVSNSQIVYAATACSAGSGSAKKENNRYCAPKKAVL